MLSNGKKDNAADIYGELRGSSPGQNLMGWQSNHVEMLTGQLDVPAGSPDCTQGSSAERRRPRNSLPIQRLQKPWAALSGPLVCTGSPLHRATALLESSSLQLPPTELGCVPALPLSESPPLPLTAIPIPTCTISSLGQMPLLPLAFSQGTVPLAPLLPSSAQILRTLPSVAQKGLTGTEERNYHFFTWDTSLVLMRPTSSHSLGSQIL